MIAFFFLMITAMGQDYSFPSSPTHQGFFYPTAYFDHAGQDWNCGTNTYSGHRGNDFGGGGFTGMDAGRDIVAAAPGTVDYVNDGEFDRCTSGACAGGGGFGNYVRINHADGKATYYAHLKSGSVTVSAGQAVTCGQKLGEMGSSGASTGPHIHFEVRNTSGTAADPFDGTCSAPPSWWVSQGAYNGLPATSCTPQSCAASDTLTCGETVTRANSGGGSSSSTEVYSCSTWSYPAPEVAWTFTPTVSEPVTLGLTGLSADLDLFVLGGGDCDADNCTASSQAGNTDPESLTFQATAGTTYTVVVDGYLGATSSFNLSASCTPPSCHAPYSPGDAEYCVACDCAVNEGDCDTDDECAGSLVCLHDRGNAFGYADNSTDVCVAPCGSDAHEPDDTPGEATVGPGTYVGLNACLGNEDWYEVELAPRDLLIATASFSHAEGDVDVRIFDPAGVEVAAGTSTDDDEIVLHAAAARGLYTVRVDLYAEGTDTLQGAAYDLDLAVDRPEVMLDVSQLVPGEPVDFTVWNAPANAQVAIFRSAGEAGPGPCHPTLPFCLDLPQPQMLTTLTTDALGEAVWTVNAPASMPIGPQTFQALVVQGDPATLSNPVTRDVLWPPLTIGDVSVVEGGAGAVVARFPVQLSTASATPVTVAWHTEDGTAMAPGDYDTTSGTLIFSPGDTLKYAELLVRGDALDEADETFTVVLTDPQGASLGGTGQGTGTIVDDDDAPTLGYIKARVIEGNTGTRPLSIPVTLSAPSGLPVTVDWVAVDHEATIPDDLLPASGTLVFAPGVTSVPVVLTVNGDLDVEPHERVAFRMSNPVNAVLPVGAEWGYGMIADDRDTGATVPGAPTGVSAQSGLNGYVRVSWTGPADTGGPPLDGYEVRQGATVRAATSSPFDWTGLTNGTAYTFSVRACNVVGCGPWSGASGAATPYTVPSVPGTPSVTSQNNAIFVDWSAPGTGGSAITRYDLSYSGTTVNAGTTSSRTVGFGQDGSARTFRVRACNAAGCSGYSAASASIRPRTIQVSRGAAAPFGYWYDTTVTGPPGLGLTLLCNDGVDLAFWSQAITVGADGTYRDSTLCYSGDLNPHWVNAGGLVSNQVNF